MHAPEGSCLRIFLHVKRGNIGRGMGHVIYWYEIRESQLFQLIK